MAHPYFSASLPRHEDLAKLETWQRRALSRSVRLDTVLLGELKQPATVQRVQTLLKHALVVRGLAGVRKYTRGWVRHISKDDFEKALAEQKTEEQVADKPPRFAALARDLLHCCRHAKQTASRDADLAGIAAAAKKKRSTATVVTEGPGPEAWPMPKRQRNFGPLPVAASLERRKELLRELEEEVELPARRKSLLAEAIPPLPSSDLTLAQVARNPDYSHSDQSLLAHLPDGALLLDRGFAATLQHLAQAREQDIPAAAAPSVLAGLVAPRLR
jgi:hypothetical protein